MDDYGNGLTQWYANDTDRRGIYTLGTKIHGVVGWFYRSGVTYLDSQDNYFVPPSVNYTTITVDLVKINNNTNGTQLLISAGGLSSVVSDSAKTSQIILPPSSSGYSLTASPFAVVGGVDGSHFVEYYLTPLATDPNGLDIRPPTIALSSDKSNLAFGQTAVISFLLSKPATDFTVDDVVLSAGKLSNFSGSGSNFTAQFTPDPNSKTDAMISVPSGAFSDVSGNKNIGDGEGQLNLYHKASQEDWRWQAPVRLL